MERPATLLLVAVLVLFVGACGDMVPPEPAEKKPDQPDEQHDARALHMVRPVVA